MTEEIIIDGVNVAGCEHYCEKINTGSGVIQNPLKQGFCLHNITGLQNADIYFRMLTFPKCREQSNCYYKQLKRLEQELKWANDEEKYLKDCCIKAGKELEKHSFKWDGKEKNLVVQALQLNQLYEKLEQENKELRKKYSNLLSKNLDKQCKINNLQNKLATQEFSLKVNGKKYAGLSGIEKAKFFINDEIATRNKKILELETFISSFQERVYNYNKKISDLEAENKELKRANQSLSMLGTDLASANETVRKEFFRADKNKDMWREKAEEYRSALEEIRENLVKLKTNDEDDFTYEFSKIEDKINEVLNDN